MSSKTIYTNGKIFTSDVNQLYANTMAVDNGVIKWIGDKTAVPSDYDAYKVVNLNSKRVIPGFVDAHMHAVMLANVCEQFSCLPPAVNSIFELIATIKDVRKKQGPDEWIQGWGYDEQKFSDKRAPDRHDLDEGCSDAPVFLLRTCAHIACVNSKALEMAGITKDSENPDNGEIEKDEHGEPTGILKEAARLLVMGIMPKNTHGKVVSDILSLGKILSSYGITTVTDMGNLTKVDNYGDYINATTKGFKQRVAIYYMWDHFMGDNDFHIPEEHLKRNQQIRVGGIKIIGDGSVSGRTAWMKKPYYGGDDHGISACSDELMEDAILNCKKYHCQLSMHAMGGCAIDRIVNRIYKEDSWTSDDIPCARIEHITEPTENAIRKTVEKGYYFVMQPIFLYAEIESYKKNLGLERISGCYPVKTMIERGVRIAFSSDAPATAWAKPYDPFANIKGAVTRVAYDGTDCGASERVDINTAIRLYTAEAARASGFLKIGMLKVGYYADFIVLDKDIININPDEIDTVKVINTFINGEEVYRA